MNKLEIRADIESTERVFVYSGAELAPALLELRKQIADELDRLKARLPAHERNEIPNISDLRKADPETQAKHRIKVLLSTSFEAQLWAAEAQRTPKQTWRLTMADLRWLYQFQAPTL